MSDFSAPPGSAAGVPAPGEGAAATAVAGSPPSAEPRDWSGSLDRVLAAPQRVRVDYQPIVDLQRGVVRGYEALARFPDEPGVPTREWFAAAARLGCAGALEAQLITAALVARPLLAHDRFIAVNVSPDALGSPEVARALAATPRLDAIVLELTDDAASPTPDLSALLAVVDGLRARGAALAIDDAGAVYGSLDRINALSPQLIKIDGAVTRDIVGSPSRAAMVRTLVDLAARLDAWLVAEQIETDRQLDALGRLGVPLGQGFAIARPAPTIGEIDRTVSQRLRQRALDGVRADGISRLAETLPAVGAHAEARAAFAAHPQAEHVVVVTEGGAPVGVIDRLGVEGGGAPREPLCVLAATALDDLVRRALARPLDRRWDPVICVDAGGAYRGAVPLERVLAALSTR